MENTEEKLPENVQAASQNPEADKDEEEILEKIKGDAIGKTLYSERFVLKTILKLSDLKIPVSEDEAFEQDLCNLWDMTIEKDVVKLLLERDTLDLFTYLIKNTIDDRLIEILVGIIGNMCCLEETIKKLLEKEDIMLSLLELIESSDNLTLVQYMRLLTAFFSQVRPNVHLLEYLKKSVEFAEKLGFIFSNTMSTELIECAFDTLRNMLHRTEVNEGDYDYDNELKKMFHNTKLLNGLQEGFILLYPPNEEQFDDYYLLTSKDYKIFTTFIDANCFFMQKDDDENDELMECLNRIFIRITKSTLQKLSRMETDLFQNIDLLLKKRGYPYEQSSFKGIMRIIKHLYDTKKTEKNDEFEDDDEEKGDNYSESILEIATNIIRMISISLTDEDFRQIFLEATADDKILMKTLNIGNKIK